MYATTTADGVRARATGTARNRWTSKAETRLAGRLLAPKGGGTKAAFCLAPTGPGPSHGRSFSYGRPLTCNKRARNHYSDFRAAGRASFRAAVRVACRSGGLSGATSSDGSPTGARALTGLTSNRGTCPLTLGYFSTSLTLSNEGLAAEKSSVGATNSTLTCTASAGTTNKTYG